MGSLGWLKFLRRIGCIFTLCGTLCPALLAQGPSAAFGSLPEASPLVSINAPRVQIEHKFLDGKNKILFTAVTALDFTDFAVTRMNLQNGGRELNPLTRPFTGSTAMLAVNFTGETLGVIGLSYFFHKTGHHKLERVTSLVSIGTSSAAASYGFAHR